MMIKTQREVLSFCLKCNKEVKGKLFFPPFSIHSNDNYIFTCLCGNSWEEEE